MTPLGLSPSRISPSENGFRSPTICPIPEISTPRGTLSLMASKLTKFLSLRSLRQAFRNIED